MRSAGTCRALATASAVAALVSAGALAPAVAAQAHTVGTVVIANGWSAADSAVAATLAAARGSPSSPAVVLYSAANELSLRTRGFIESHRPDSVVLVGGEQALSAGVASAVARLTGSVPERIAGADRYETAASAVPEAASVLMVANGHSPADIGVAAALAAVSGNAAVLLASRGSLTSATEQVIADRQPDLVIFIGGADVLADSLADRVSELAPWTAIVSRRGSSRTDTAASAADWAETLVIADGWSPADTGVAAALTAGSGSSAVLYAQRHTLTEPTSQRIAELQPSLVLLVGGTEALSVALHHEVHCLAPGAEVRRISGSDRIDTAARAAEGMWAAVSLDFDCGGEGGGSDGSDSGDGRDDGSPSASYSNPALALQYHDPEPYPAAVPIHDATLTAPVISDAAYNPDLWNWTNRVWKLEGGSVVDVTTGVGDSETNFCRHVGVPLGDPCDWHINWALYTCQQMAAGAGAAAFTDAVLNMMTWQPGRPNGTERRVRAAVSAGVRTCAVSPESPVAAIWDFDASASTSYWRTQVASKES